MKKLLAFMLMFAFAVVLVGCKDKKPEKINVTAAGNKTTLLVGDTVQLTATVLPEGVDQSVEWEAVMPNIASVSETGLVTAVSQGTTLVRAISKVNQVVGNIAIKVVVEQEEGETRPDLGGYTITIAQASHALNEIDPFHENYVGTGIDQTAKQQAWNWVKEKYNCDIQVVAYPEDAPWGPARWNYILQQAANNTSDYDFLTVPDSKISTFVEGDALIDVTEWYDKYGKGSMDEVYKLSGTYDKRLYSITGGTSSIYGVLYYNKNLLDRLDLEKTPAQLFNDGEWTYSKFKEYLIEVQTALDGINDGKEYIAITGNATYLWVGMAQAGGVRLADTVEYKLNLKHEISIQAAQTLKEIYEAGAFDDEMSVDASMTLWMDGTAVFALGDLWFVNTSNRWPENLWGEGELTKYDYVPYPRPDGTTKEQQEIGLGGTATFVMPIGKDYSGYTENVTPENIYRAMIDTFIKTKEFRENDPEYDQETYLRSLASSKCESEDSIQAFMYMTRRIFNGEIGFYDPLSTPDNPITNTGDRSSTNGGTLAYRFNSYVKGDITTFAEAVDPLIPTLQETLRKAYS